MHQPSFFCSRPHIQSLLRFRIILDYSESDISWWNDIIHPSNQTIRAKGDIDLVNSRWRVERFYAHMERFHSRGHHLRKFIGTKESFCIRRESNSHRISLGHQHSRRFIVLGHQYGRRDVMWKHSLTTFTIHSKPRVKTFLHFWLA